MRCKPRIDARGLAVPVSELPLKLPQGVGEER
jgi:hypothetical protein